MTVHDIRDNRGGWKLGTGEQLHEISETWTFSFPKDMPIEEARKKTDLFASLLGDLGPEQQEAVISYDYVEAGNPEANTVELTVGFNDVEKAVEALKRVGISDYSIDQDGKAIKLDYIGTRYDGGFAGFEKKYKELVTQLKKDRNHDGRTGENEKASRLLQAADRRNKYRAWLGATQTGEQSGTMRRYVEETSRRLDEFQRRREANLADDTAGVQGEGGGTADGDARVHSGAGGSSGGQSVLKRDFTERHDNKTQGFFSSVVKEEAYADYKQQCIRGTCIKFPVPLIHLLRDHFHHPTKIIQHFLWRL